VSPTRNPYRRTLVGVVVGVVEGARTGQPDAVEARVAIYVDRHSAEPIATVPVRWPAGTFRPSVGARLAVNVDPVE
jgi:hypothetical protein